MIVAQLNIFTWVSISHAGPESAKIRICHGLIPESRNNAAARIPAYGKKLIGARPCEKVINPPPKPQAL